MNLEPTGSPDMWRRQMVLIASWLVGTLDGRSEDQVDHDFSDAINAWLEYQKLKYDSVMVGRIECPNCGDAKESLVFASSLPFLQCSKCGMKLDTLFG